MACKEPFYYTDPDELVDHIIGKVGGEISFGAQNGLGKPNNILNALFRRAHADPTIKLRIITALSLEPPTWTQDLERRILEPMIERIWGGYIPLEYTVAARENRLPPNVEINEFYYRPGAYLHNDYMQQNYISTNYTHAARDVVGLGMNVGGALISMKDMDGRMKISLGWAAMEIWPWMSSIFSGGKKRRPGYPAAWWARLTPIYLSYMETLSPIHRYAMLYSTTRKSKHVFSAFRESLLITSTI